MSLREKYANAKPIATRPLSAWGGLVILDVDGDTAVAAFEFGTGFQNIRRHKIQTTPGGRSYIWKGRTRYYLDEIARCG